MYVPNTWVAQWIGKRGRPRLVGLYNEASAASALAGDTTELGVPFGARGARSPAKTVSAMPFQRGPRAFRALVPPYLYDSISFMPRRI